MTDPVLMRRADAVMIVAINTPERRNAIDHVSFVALTIAIQQSAKDPDVGAIVLTGANGYFCSGGDLRQLARRLELSAEERRYRLGSLNNLMRMIRDCEKPVIAAVEGGAAGAGFSLALVCDVLVAASDAVFSGSYVKVGLTPDGGLTAFLTEALPRQLVTELCMLGDRIGAERLHSMGVVNCVTQPGEAEAEAIAMAARLAAGPWRATARIKALCRGAQYTTLDQQLDIEAEYMVESQADAESEEGINAFLSKRSPDFRKIAD